MNEKLADIMFAKIVSMIVLFSASFLMGVVPVILSKYYKWRSSSTNNALVRVLLCFGGGVLFCTTFIHLLPEVREGAEALMESGALVDIELPWPECLMCFGLLLMYFVEEAVHFAIFLRSKNVTSDINMQNISEIPVPMPHNTHHHNIEIENFRGYLIVLALSTHELFEGLAVGLEKSTVHVWYLLVAISAHKFVIAFCLGLKLSLTHITPSKVIQCVFTFAFVSPLGIGVGCVMTNSILLDYTELPQVVLQGIATGTLLYVVIFEILQKNADGGLKIYFAFLIGFLLMAVLQMTSIGLGIILSSGNVAIATDAASTATTTTLMPLVLQAMAAGTLLYVVFFEVLAREKNNKHCGLWQFFAIIVGFSTMFALQVFTQHEHEHGHGHDDHDHVHKLAQTFIANMTQYNITKS